MAEIKLSPEQASETKGKPKRNVQMVIIGLLVAGVFAGVAFNKSNKVDDFEKKKEVAADEKVKNANKNGDMDIAAMTAKIEAERIKAAEAEKEKNKEADNKFRDDIEKKAEANNKADKNSAQETPAEPQVDPKVEEENRRREQIASESVYVPVNGKSAKSPLDDVLEGLNKKQAEGMAALDAISGQQVASDDSPSATQATLPLTRAQEAEKWQSDKEKSDPKHAPVKVSKAGDVNNIIREGTIINAGIYSLVTSDFPGKVIAKTTRPVYNRKGQVLIPAGSRVLGIANADVRPGQERMMVAFYRVIMPNDDSIYLSGMQGLDNYGTTGVDGDVNNHFFRMFGSSFLIAAIQSVFTSNDNSTTINSGGGSITIQESAGQTIGEAGRAILNRNSRIPPTISFRQGQEINVLVTKDIQIDPYTN